MTELAAAPEATLHPLLDQLATRHGFTVLDADTLDAFLHQPGHAVLVFTEDPVRYRETLDLAVIAPEVARAFHGRFRCGVLYPEAARKLAPRFGFTRWPALVMVRDGAYVGAIDGLRNWDQYLEETLQLLTAEPTRAPSIGIAVKSADAQPSGCGH
jgi:hydrogenase-1 operon protein HyaE